MTDPTVDIQLWASNGAVPTVTVTLRGAPQDASKELLEALTQVARQAYATMSPHVLAMADHAAKAAPPLASTDPPPPDQAGSDPSGFDLSKCPDHSDRTQPSKKGEGFYCRCGWSTTIYRDPGEPAVKKWKLDGAWLERDEYITALKAPRTPQAPQSAAAAQQAGAEW